MMNLLWKRVELQEALVIVSWEYDPPYENYNLKKSPLAIAKLLDGNYISAYSGKELMGFFCYGKSAQLINNRNHELYQNRNYLDVGFALNPKFCGQGNGNNFLKAGLTEARKCSWQGGFRLTVAPNNVRALRVYRRVGFEEQGQIIWNSQTGRKFMVLTLDNFEPKLKARLER